MLLSIVFIFALFMRSSASKLLIAHLGDFELENGSVIQDCKIAYRTFGQLNSEKSNVILFPTWFGGTSDHLAGLIGPGKLVDSTDYLIIAVDALGNGLSSSPSNSKFQPGRNFPEFSIHDMVRSQFLLLNTVLGIHKLDAIIGGSMGGMQTFDWLVSYPDFMEKAIPYVGSPQLTSYDLFLFTTQRVLLEMGLKQKCPQDSLLGAVSAIQMLAAYTPKYFVEKNRREDFHAYFNKRFREVSRVFTAENYIAQLKAMITHDISKYFQGSLEKAASAVKAKVLVIVSEQDHIINPQPALQFAQWINAQTMVLTNPCGHLAVGCEMEQVVEVVKQFLKE